LVGNITVVPVIRASKATALTLSKLLNNDLVERW